MTLLRLKNPSIETVIMENQRRKNMSSLFKHAWLFCYTIDLACFVNFPADISCTS